MSGVAVAGAGLAQAQPPARTQAPVQAQAPAPAQLPAAAGRRPDLRMSARYQVAMMESILETAVQQGAGAISRQWRTMAPDILMMGGAARARGFRLGGYGVFFDVEVPALRQSVMWSWRVLDRDAGGVSAALQSLKDYVKTVNDPAMKRQLDQDIRRLELQVGPLPKAADAARAVVVGPEGGGAGAQAVAGVPASAREAEPAADPNDAYTTEVQNALVDAMLDHSNALTIGPDEWLAIAARDSESQQLAVDEPFDVVTILIRIKGSDLIALRTGRITRDEARRRVEISEF